LQAAARNLGWLLASRSLLAVLSLFYLGIATRALGLEGFGRFALITGAAQTLATLVAFQTWQVIVQYGVAPAAIDDQTALGRLFRGCALLDLGSALLGALLAWGLLALWGEALGIGPALKRATLVYAIVQLVTIRSTPLGILRLRDRFALSALADSVTPAVRFLGALLMWAVFPTVEGFLAVWAVAEVLTAAAYWIMVMRHGDLRLIRKARGVRRLRVEHPGIVHFALSTNASATLGLSGKQLPLLLVGAIAGTAAAGVIRLAAQIAQALAKLSQLISRAAFPEVVRMVREASSADLSRLMRRLFVGSAVGGAAIMLLVAVAGKPVLALVAGQDFPDAWPVLLWLSLAGCLDLATTGVDTVLTAVRRAGQVFAIRLVGVAAMLTIVALTARSSGAVGVAMAVTAASAVMAALMAAAARLLARSRPA
jgi:O-antigen/teichoic acid export membrane protein